MIELRAKGGLRSALSLAQIKAASWDHPGPHRLQLLVPSLRRAEPTRLTLGGEWRYSGSEECLKALSAFGEARVLDEGAPGGESVDDQAGSS